MEHVLNYGDWDDVQGMIKILGMKRTAKIFRENSKGDKFGRQNYKEKSKYYFTLYFKTHVPASRNFNKRTTDLTAFNGEI